MTFSLLPRVSLRTALLVALGACAPCLPAADLAAPGAPLRIAQANTGKARATPPKPAPKPEPEEPDDDDEPLTEVPERDEAQIARARAVTLTAATLPRELASIAAAIRGAMESPARDEALRLLARFQGQSQALANGAAVAWVQRFPEQALLLAAEAAKAKPDDVHALNNLGALLAHAGYEHKAIPLLRHLATVLPTDATVLSNLGVAWLNIGEVAEAKAVLTRCLAAAPGHGTANLAAGVIATAEKRKAEATEHFNRASASNSSPLARQVLRKQRTPHRAPPGFMGFLPKQEYFSPSSIAPLEPQRTLAEHPLKAAAKKAYDAKLASVGAGLSHAVQEETMRMISGGTRGPAAKATNPYAKFDWPNHLQAIADEARLKLATDRMAARMLAISKIRLEYERTRTPGVPEDPVPSCVRRRPIAQAALEKMAFEYEKMVAETLFIWRDSTNARLTALRFMMPNDPMYRASFDGNVAAYIGFVQQLNRQLPLVEDPCANQGSGGAPAYELVPPTPGPCPFSLDFNVIIATLHMDCTNFGFDFQAGLAFSANKDFTSGETTLTAGVGAKTDLMSVGKASVSGQLVLTWNRENDLSYVGVEAIAGAKLSGVPGLSGTLATDTLDLGRDPGADSDAPSATISGEALTQDIVKVGSDTKLGVTIGPKGVEPTLSGDITGKVFGEKIFEAKLP
jgi:tetratricopeptide (TPR) repeat protein